MRAGFGGERFIAAKLAARRSSPLGRRFPQRTGRNGFRSGRLSLAGVGHIAGSPITPQGLSVDNLCGGGVG